MMTVRDEPDPARSGSSDANITDTEIECAQCGVAVKATEAIQTESKAFCRGCYARLRQLIEDHAAAQSQDINYTGAVIGGLLGGLVGALVWWGFTVLTNIAFGLIAVLIGFGAGHGVVRFSGGKRSVSLQAISLVIALFGFAQASYWVNRTFLQRAFAENDMAASLPLFPTPDLFFEVVKLGFNFIDVVFLAIVAWQAWKIPQPFKLP